MARNDGRRLQRGDLPQRGDPRAALLGRRRLHQPLVQLVVADVARDDHVQGGDVQERGVVRVGVAGLDDAQRVALQLDGEVGGERLHQPRRRLGELLRERGDPPRGVEGGLFLLRHVRDGRARGDRAGVREVLEERAQGEVVVAVAVGDEDRREGFVGDHAFDPPGEVVGLVFGEGRVNEDGFFVAVDQGRGHV